MFSLGFYKIAMFSHNNQGLEFKMSDPGQPNMGAGGMAPSGIPSYQPLDATDTAPAPTNAKKRGKKPSPLATSFIFGKVSGVGHLSNTDHSISTQDSPTTEQLKWTSQHGVKDQNQISTDIAEAKNRALRYRKAAKR